jgi:hypothetical protein
MKPRSIAQEEEAVSQTSMLPCGEYSATVFSLPLGRLTLLLICILVQATTLVAEGPAGKGSDRKIGESTVASAAGRSWKDRDLVVDCSKDGSRLSDQTLCGDVPTRAAAVQVPEPSSLFLVGCGLLLMAAFLRRRLIRIKSPDSASR